MHSAFKTISVERLLFQLDFSITFVKTRQDIIIKKSLGKPVENE